MNKNPPKSKPNPLLWWVAAFSLIVSGALFYLLGSEAEVDVHIRQVRMIFPLVGVVIAGICLIAGTASRWFYPR